MLHIIGLLAYNALVAAYQDFQTQNPDLWVLGISIFF